jgi:WD40 repeat protein/class 3 adenylate cyclase/energy-coupling factor transporter ATP-binding protein EcfA2
MATVTFFFADQAGSTVQLERLGDAGAKGIRQALIDMLRQAAEDHSGDVVDHTGDGLMITFASAVDAVACGVAVQQQAARHNARHPEAEALGVRVGIHTGEPLVNDEGRYFGVPVVVAARLCAAADTGQVLVSDVTRALVAPRRAHGFTALGERALKGIAEPVVVAAVDWAPEDTEFALPEVLAAAAAGPFVGRAAELAWLEGLWGDVGAAGGTARRRVALLAGDPGIGKTRLAAALAVAVEERGGLVLHGGCDEEPAGPYQPLVEALGPYVAAVPRAELRQQLGPAGGVLTRVLPELAERVPHLTGPARLEQETEPYLVAEAAEAFLVAVARTTPTLLVLDDLHWADAATLLVVRQLARGTAPAPLLVLGCYREPDVGRSRVLAEAGVDPRRPGPVQHRRLTGLLTPEVAELLGTLIGETPSDTLVRTVDAETEGNPFFVHQLAGNLAERKLAQQVGRAARRAETTRLDLRGVREELVAGVLELQRLRDRPAPGQGPDAAGHAGLLVEAPVEPDGTPPVPTAVPYKGLVRFEAGDAGLFCGREQLVAELVARLVAARFVAVVGPSGSGKSSLVRAGLLPTLAGGALPGSDTWEPLVLAPGPDPVRALAERLGPHLPGADPTALAARLQAGPDALAQVAAEALAGRPDTARLLLVVDQFEEVFTACRDEAARRRFVEPLVAAATAREGRCVVALALRADFYGRCAAHPELAAELADSQVLVGPMTDEELRRAVVEPARRVGCVVEPGLPETILEDVAAEPGALPLVSTALLETWERRRGRSLTLTAYAETGGVRGAVARLADGVYDGFDPAEQAVARGVFLRLTEPGEGVDDLRRRARRDELGDDPVTGKVLGVLIARRLVIADQDTVEVAHEALLREWPRLRGWLEEDREGRRLHHQLGEAAAGWVAHERDPEQLYRGARLAAALDWARAHTLDLNQREREFLDAGRAHHERQLRRARRTTAVLAGLLVLALVAGGLALVQRSTARRQAVLADSGRLAALATERLDGQLDVAMLLAVEGRRLHDATITRGALLSAVGHSPRLTGLHHEFGSRMFMTALSPDGAVLAVCHLDNTLRFWDMPARTPRTPPIHAHDGQYFVGAFSRDGRLFASAGADGMVRLWDPANGRPVGKPHKGHEGPIAVPAFSPDGRRLATVGSDGSVRIWDLPSGRPVQSAVLDQAILRSVQFSPDGRLLAIGTLDGTVRLLDAATLDQIGRPLPVPPGDVFSLAFSPDGGLLATASSQDAILLWNVGSRTQRGQPLVGHEGQVLSLRFGPDGTTLASGDLAGRVVLWDVERGTQIGPPMTGHAASAWVTGFTEEGQGLVTSGTNEVATWDLRALTLGTQLQVHRGGAFALARSGDGRLVASGGNDDTVRLWDQAGRPVGSPMRLPGDVYSLAFSRDRRRMAAAVFVLEPRPHGWVVIWEVATGRQLAKIPTEPTWPLSVEFTPDQTMVVAGLGNGEIRRWTADGGRPVGTPIATEGQANGVAVRITPDGGTFVAAVQDKLALFDARTGARVAVLAGHTDNIMALSISADGSRAASVGFDGKLILWDLARRKAVGEPLVGGAGARFGVAFSPDGTTVATVGDDRSVVLWDVATRQRLGAMFGHVGASRDATFAPDGRSLATIDDEGSLAFWNLEPSTWEAKACQLAGRNLTHDEWTQFVGGDYHRTCPQWPSG